MKRIALILAFAAAAVFAAPASAQAPKAKRPAAAETAKPVLTIGQALGILSAARSLDGRMVMVKQNGQDAAIMQPWDFGSGSLRVRILKTIAALEPNVKIEEDARRKIVTEILAGMPPGTTEIKSGTPEYTKFLEQREQMLKEPAVGGDQVYTIKASELRLDRNEIPISVLAGLEPILDVDVPLK